MIGRLNHVAIAVRDIAKASLLLLAAGAFVSLLGSGIAVSRFLKV